MKPLHFGFYGKFSSVKIIKESTGQIVKELPEFPNLIVDLGLDYVAPGTTNALKDCSTHMAVGLGTTPPTNSDTSLGNRVGGYVSSISEVETVANLETNFIYSTSVREYRFNAGTIDGQPLTEIGLFSGTSSPTMWSRTLIKDEFGDPTSITLLSDEILIITYEFRLYIPRSLGSGTFVVSGVTYEYEIVPVRVDLTSIASAWSTSDRLFRASFLGAESRSTLYEPTDNVSVNQIASNSWGLYTPGSFSRVVTPGTVGINDANFTGGIRSLILKNDTNSARCFAQILITNPLTGEGIPKTEDEQLTFEDFITVTWGRYVP